MLLANGGYYAVFRLYKPAQRPYIALVACAHLGNKHLVGVAKVLPYGPCYAHRRIEAARGYERIVLLRQYLVERILYASLAVASGYANAYELILLPEHAFCIVEVPLLYPFFNGIGYKITHKHEQRQY